MTTDSNAVRDANESVQYMPSVRLSDFTMVCSMNELVRQLWWSGSERTDWTGTGFTFEEPIGWAIENFRIDTTVEPALVTIHFVKLTHWKRARE